LSKPAPIEEVRKYLAEKINALKRELEFYEFLLKLVDREQRVGEEGFKRSEVIEVRVDTKTIGLISKKQGSITLNLIAEIAEKLFEPESLSKRLKMLGEGVRVSVSSDERGMVKEVVVSGISSSILIDGAIEILKQYVIDRFLLATSSRR